MNRVDTLLEVANHLKENDLTAISDRSKPRCKQRLPSSLPWQD
jgi:hypothetical protein